MFHLTAEDSKYEVKDFQKDVLEASYEKPVVVDFWAPWCGPCRIIGPVLERLAEEQQDRWKLVKVNTDIHQDVAMEYGIRGIPTVKLFVNGEVVDEFVGALPEPLIRQWLDSAIPDPTTEAVRNALSLWIEGKKEEAKKVVEAAEKETPEHPAIKIFHAFEQLETDPQAAKELVADIDIDSPLYPYAEAIRTFADLYAVAANPEELPDDPVKELYLEAIQALQQHDYDKALEKFIEVIRENRYYNEDSARIACLAIFGLLGEEHPIVKKHRPSFNSSLYI